jgi:phosphatidylethanolamine-binding protein (PEBP) family uncharacterized protein
MTPRWLGRLLRNVHAGERHSLAHHPTLSGVPETISLESPWFLNGEHMPPRSAGIGVGDNISPPFAWKGIPAETVELAILMEDLDVPLPRPVVHTVAYGISPDHGGLAEGAFNVGMARVAFGRGTLGNHGYAGPRPLPGHGPHRYLFHLLALNRPARFTSAPGAKEFMKGVAGTVVARGVWAGTYEQK